MNKGLLGRQLVSLLCMSGMLFIVVTLTTMVYAPKASALLKDVLAPVLSPSDEKEETTEQPQERSATSGEGGLLSLPLPELKLELPEIRVDTPIVKVETPSVKVETGRDIRDTRIDVPSVKVETPIAKVETPKVEANTKSVVPEVRVTVPEVEVKTPVIRAVTPEVKVEVKPDPVLPDIGITLPPAEVKTPIVDVETPAVEVQLPAPGKQRPDEGGAVEVEVEPAKPLTPVEIATPSMPTDQHVTQSEAVMPEVPAEGQEVPTGQEPDPYQAEPVQSIPTVGMPDPVSVDAGGEEVAPQLERESTERSPASSTAAKISGGMRVDDSKPAAEPSHRDQEQSRSTPSRPLTPSAQTMPALPPVWSSAGPSVPSGSGASGQGGTPGTGGASATPIHLTEAAVAAVRADSGTRLSTLYLLGKDQWCQPPPGQPPMYAFFSDVCDAITHI